MLHQAGKPELIKKMNIELIYQTLIALGSATRGEIAEATHMSVTTVRSLLEELVTLGEIVESDLDVSSGGRRPQRYILSPNRNRVLVLYLEEDRLYFRVNKLNGEILEENSVAIMPKSAEADAVRFASKCKELWNVSAIGLGVPGVVEKSGFLVDNGWGRWTINDIGKQMQHALNLPMLLENDLNAVALGFCRQYIHQHPQYQMEQMNVAYIYLDRICSGSGIIAGGKIVRGDKGFGGELGYLPMGGGMTLDQAVMIRPNISRRPLLLLTVWSIPLWLSSVATFLKTAVFNSIKFGNTPSSKSPSECCQISYILTASVMIISRGCLI